MTTIQREIDRADVTASDLMGSPVPRGAYRDGLPVPSRFDRQPRGAVKVQTEGRKNYAFRAMSGSLDHLD